MRLCSIKNYIYIYISKNQIKGEDCCKLCYCCCSLCNKNNKPKLNNDIYIEKDRHFDTDNNNQINDFGGIKGIIGKLEDNKVTFNINTDSGSRKIAETVEEYNGDFNYEKVKNLKVKLLGFNFNPETIEKQIEIFKCNRMINHEYTFLKDKILVGINDKDKEYIYNYNDDKLYIKTGSFVENIGYYHDMLINVDKKTLHILNYGIIPPTISRKNPCYIKRKSINKTKDINSYDFIYDKEKQEEYKKCFLEGK